MDEMSAKIPHLIVLLGAVASLALAACGVFEVGLDTPGPPATTVPPALSATPADAEMPGPPTASVPVGTAAGAPGVAVLPAPLYFILAPGGQIWRLEPDAVRLTQITFEAAAVTGFDLARDDGRLVYVSDNDLIQSDAAGGDRTELVNGPDTFGSEQANREITNPRWSPDSRQIAFGLNGLNLIDAGGGRAPRLLLQNDAVPAFDGEATEPAGPVKFYRPVAWSPDGTRLLLEWTSFPHGGAWVVLDIATGDQFPILPPEGFPCCDPAWSTDGRYIFFANDRLGMIAPGLWRAQVDTGEIVTLIAGAGEIGVIRVRDARQLADGLLYFFQAARTDVIEDWPLMTMYRADASGDALAGVDSLPAEAHRVAEAVWDPLGRGAAIVAATPDSTAPTAGDLLWLPADGRPAIPLMSNATHLRWGPVE